MMRPEMRRPKFIGLLALSGIWSALLPHLTCSAESRVDVSMLKHGINLTRWLSSTDERPLNYYRSYLNGVPSLLRDAGFTYVRVPLSPIALQRPDGTLNEVLVSILIQGLVEIQRAGLAVMVVPMVQGWHLQEREEDRQKLLDFWDRLAPRLAQLDQKMTFPEVVNEPSFSDNKHWDALQETVVAVIRDHLPYATVVVTGINWSSISGLQQVKVLADSNLVYSFHFYKPQFLTSMFPEIPDSDKGVLRELPFPVRDENGCRRITAAAVTVNSQQLVAWYCTHNGSAADINTEIAAAARWASVNGVSVINTEFGIRSDRPESTRINYIETVRRACEMNQIGWSLWGLDDGFGFNIRPGTEDPPKLEPHMLRALGL
jgi:endoglucanase